MSLIDDLWQRATRPAPKPRLPAKAPAPTSVPATRIVEEQLELDGTPLPVTIRLDRRARRISLRVDPSRGQVLITAPPRAGIKQALGFAQTQAGWIRKRLARMPQAKPFAPGTMISVQGQDLILTHCPDQRGNVWIDGDKLCVAGAVDHMARRVTDWLKLNARKVLAEQVALYCSRINKPVPKVQVRDSLTRWGSCSSTGVISFSWRLILAPPFVMEYVAAHEVCHLVHMNHSVRFWNLCESLIDDCERPKAWLNAFGVTLHRIGKSA
jgi:predicted metal-dependent hydrolase